MKTLYIAEKRTLANTVAEHLWPDGKYTKNATYYEKGDTAVAWAAGHILELAMPESYDPKYAYWDNFPIYPKRWILRENPQKIKLINTIKSLLPKYDCVVNVGDPDREGQLLIDEILYYFQYKGQVKRLLLHGLDKTNVDRDFKNIIDNKKMYPLYLAGMCRLQADWLVGINLTRAYTAACRKFGYMNTFVVGRVMIPTLGILVRLEREILNFQPKDFYELVGTFSKDNIKFKATFVPDDSISTDTENRILDKTSLDMLEVSLKGEPVTVLKAEKKNAEEKPPLPHSMDTLQVKANAKYGYSPTEVMDAVESMYLKKIVTYPRSDCNYLPVSQFEDAQGILANLVKAGFPAAKKANRSIKSACWNDKKVTAHTAIIPTAVAPTGLSEKEKNIYDLIALNYILQFYPPCKKEKITFQLKVKDAIFKGSGSKIVSKGFREVLSEDKDKSHKEDENAVLPSLNAGDTVKNLDYNTLSKQTTPPKRLTEGTLIKLMSTVWKLLPKDSPNREKLKEVKGIGTSATRNDIIEKLQATSSKGHNVQPYIKKQKNFLVPTEFGFFVYDNIDQSLTYPDTTAEMEYALTKIAQGEMDPNKYIDTVKDMIEKNMEYAKHRDFPVNKDLVQCPICKKAALRRIRTQDKRYLFVCPDNSCVHPKTGKKIYYPAKGKASDKPLIVLCPKCGLPASYHKGKFGVYWTCDNCGIKLNVDEKKGTATEAVKKQLNVTEFLCPICKKGHLIHGKGFYYCENHCSHPDDKTAKKDQKPLFYNEKDGKPDIRYCPECKNSILVSRKGKYGVYWHCHKCNKNFNDSNCGQGNE